MDNKILILIFTAVYLLLFTSTFFLQVIRRKNPYKSYHELSNRIKSWWFMVTVFVLAILLGKGTSVLLFAFMSFLALKEFFTLVPTRRADRSVLMWCYLSIPVQAYWIYTGRYDMFIIFIPVYMFLLMPFRMIIKGETDDFLKSLGIMHWGLMICVYSIGHAAFLISLPSDNSPVNGSILVVFLLLLTELNDIAQYIWGKAIGKRAIVPKVSPNKTWGGFLGGVLTTLVLSASLGPILIKISLFHSVLLGLIIGVSGFVGDVVISAVKRNLAVKDSGNLIPGHGGILDRVDSLTFTAPLFFHFIRYFYF